ncbi:response regulator transcription factor [Ornithinimicrobium sp. LYQ103]|uniref:helix-turn-helix transcriptional regulator n=1 Tax=Ornithinimicrobium sp. LYQ103 TaxID=3378796 RepID=UPI00385201BD
MGTFPLTAQAPPGVASPSLLAGGRREGAPRRRAGRGRVLRVEILDECPLIVLGAQAMLQPYAATIEVHGAELVGGAPEGVDVTLYDPAGRASSSPAALEALLADPARGRIVIYSLDPPPALVAQWLTKGCAAFVDKGASTAVLVEVITSLAPGLGAGGWEARAVPARPGPAPGWPGHEHGLSRRESEVICLIVDGLTNKDIGERTFLSVSTVKTHIRSAYRKLDIDRRAQAVRWGMQHGMLAPPTPHADAQATG